MTTFSITRPARPAQLAAEGAFLTALQSEPPPDWRSALHAALTAYEAAQWQPPAERPPSADVLVSLPGHKFGAPCVLIAAPDAYRELPWRPLPEPFAAPAPQPFITQGAPA